MTSFMNDPLPRPPLQLRLDDDDDDAEDRVRVLNGRACRRRAESEGCSWTDPSKNRSLIVVVTLL